VRTSERSIGAHHQLHFLFLSDSYFFDGAVKLRFCFPMD
jgi:hypothetical protein